LKSFFSADFLQISSLRLSGENAAATNSQDWQIQKNNTLQHQAGTQQYCTVTRAASALEILKKPNTNNDTTTHQKNYIIQN